MVDNYGNIWIPRCQSCHCRSLLRCKLPIKREVILSQESISLLKIRDDAAIGATSKVVNILASCIDMRRATSIEGTNIIKDPAYATNQWRCADHLRETLLYVVGIAKIARSDDGPQLRSVSLIDERLHPGRLFDATKWSVCQHLDMDRACKRDVGLGKWLDDVGRVVFREISKDSEQSTQPRREAIPSKIEIVVMCVDDASRWLHGSSQGGEDGEDDKKRGCVGMKLHLLLVRVDWRLFIL
mmetsp:Transcript_49/g.91  ORF Transcript_49/g.91 Transcript_49/m.91 type:complete len:241 (-) Transcript_49:9-731(-)